MTVWLGGSAPAAAGSFDLPDAKERALCQADGWERLCARTIVVAQAGSSGGSVVPPAAVGKKRKTISSGTAVQPAPAARPEEGRVAPRPQVDEERRRPSRATPRRAARSAARPAARAARCPNIAGVWSSWASGIVGKQDTTFYADGTGRHRMGFRAKWWCDNGQLHIEWPDGRPGVVTVSADGRRILGLDGGVHMSRD